jgi:hypothetical protein
MLPTKPRQLLSLLARVRLPNRPRTSATRATIAAWRMCLNDEQGELVRRDKLAFVKNPLNVLQEIELAPVAGRSGHLPLPLQ